MSELKITITQLEALLDRQKVMIMEKVVEDIQHRENVGLIPISKQKVVEICDRTGYPPRLQHSKTIREMKNEDKALIVVGILWVVWLVIKLFILWHTKH